MFNIPIPQGDTGIAKTKSLWPNLPKPKLEPNSPSLGHLVHFILPNLHKQYNRDVINDVMIIYSFISAAKALMHVQLCHADSPVHPQMSLTYPPPVFT